MIGPENFNEKSSEGVDNPVTDKNLTVKTLSFKEIETDKKGQQICRCLIKLCRVEGDMCESGSSFRVGEGHRPGELAGFPPAAASQKTADTGKHLS